MTDKEVIEGYMRQVENDAKHFRGITPEVAEFPYGTEGARAITWNAWVIANIAMSEPDGAAQNVEDVDSLTEGAFTRAIGIFVNVPRDFTRVINGLRRGAKSDTGETVGLDRFGCPNIAPYMAGCRASVSVSVEDVGNIDLESFVAPWHGREPIDYPEFATKNEALIFEEDGKKWAIKPYDLLWPWDMYRIIANLCAAGFERSIRGLLGGKAGAKLASELEDKAAVIQYENMPGVMVGYSKACDELDKAFMSEIVKGRPGHEITYTPKPGEWGPTMKLTLPLGNEVRAWKAAGGNPQQLKRLRGAVYTMLLHESTPYWWKRYQVTLTLGQVERGLYNDADHHLTDDERTLLLASFDLLTKTHIDCTYPPKDKKSRHSHIDESKLAIHGLTLFPAVWVEETDANGHVVNAAFKFYAMPPLDAQADELNHAYTLPYLNGTPRLPAIGEQRKGARRERIESTTYDVQTALAKYIRIAKSEGAATVYIDTLVSETEPFKVEEIATLIEFADAGYIGGEAKDAEECKKEKQRQQQRMRNLRSRVKKDVLRVLPLLIENEATAERPHYLNVDTASGRRDGFTITRVKQTDRQRKEHREPVTHFMYGKKPQARVNSKRG